MKKMILSLVLVIGCEGPRPLDAQTFVTEVTYAMCDAMKDCGCGDQFTREQCYAANRPYFELFTVDPRVDFQPEAAEVYLERMAEARETCYGPFLDWPVRGTVPLGASCAGGAFVCEPGAECDSMTCVVAVPREQRRICVGM